MLVDQHLQAVFGPLVVLKLSNLDQGLQEKVEGHVHLVLVHRAEDQVNALLIHKLLL